MDQSLVAGGNRPKHRFRRVRLRNWGKWHRRPGIRGQSCAGHRHPFCHILYSRGGGVWSGGALVDKGEQIETLRLFFHHQLCKLNIVVPRNGVVHCFRSSPPNMSSEARGPILAPNQYPAVKAIVTARISCNIVPEQCNGPFSLPRFRSILNLWRCRNAPGRT